MAKRRGVKLGGRNAQSEVAEREARERAEKLRPTFTELAQLSAHKAAVKAGFQRRTMSIPADDAERAFRRLSGDKGMDREQLVLLAKLLKEHLLTKED